MCSNVPGRRRSRTDVIQDLPLRQCVTSFSMCRTDSEPPIPRCCPTDAGAIPRLLLHVSTSGHLLLSAIIPGPTFSREFTIIVWPFTYENNGLATAKIALAASVAVPGLLRGISACALLPPASFWAFGIPRATLFPSGVVTKAPSSFAAVRRVRMWPNATL